MRMCKKMLCLALSLALLLMAVSCALGEEEAAKQTHRLRLGSSIYTIEIDDSFTYGVVTEEEAAEGLVAYLYSNIRSMDFDVYQLKKEDETQKPGDFAAKEAEAYDDVTELVTDGEINGFPAAWYRTTQTFGDQDYGTLTYVLEDGDDFVELVFWMDGDQAEAEVKAIVDSLEFVPLNAIRLGTSPFSVLVMSNFVEGEMTDEDIADDQVAYWRSDETRLDFDVYQFSKEGYPENLADYVAEEAAGYDMVSELVTDAVINDIPLAWYRTMEEYEGDEYETVTCVMDSGDEYVELVFWLDGYSAAAEADAIIKSLWRDEDVEAGAQAGDAESAGDTADAEDMAEPADEDEGLTDEDFEVLLALLGVEHEALEDMTEEEIEALQGKLEALLAELEAFTDEADTEGEALTDEDSAEAEGFEDERPEANAEDSEAGEEAEVEELASDEAPADEEDEIEPEGDAYEDVTADEESEIEPEGDAYEDVTADEEAEEAEDEGEAETDGTYALQLGTSAFYMNVPEGFVPGEMTEEDIADDQVGYYYSSSTLLDFDVYQFKREGDYPDQLEEYVEWEAIGYEGVSELVTNGEINGVPAGWYRTVEQYEEAEYNTVTYVLEDGDDFVEVVFWLDGDNADEEAAAIISTLSLVQTPADAAE